MSQRASILRRQRRIQEKDREKKELFPHPSLQKNQVKVKDCKNSPIIQSSLKSNRNMIESSLARLGMDREVKGYEHGCEKPIP